MLMGREHEAACMRMSLRAALHVAAACVCLAVACSPLLLALPLALLAWAAAEGVFVFVYASRWATLSYQPIKHRPLSHDPVAAFNRTMAHLVRQGADIRSFLSIWFHGAPFATIRRGNVRDLLAYAFWYKTPTELAAEGNADALEAQVAWLEATWGLTLQPGFDPALSIMAHLWEPMRHWYRPLAFYAVMEVGAGLLRVALHAAGFERQVVMGLPYYTRNMPGGHAQHAAATAAAGQPSAFATASSSSSTAPGAGAPWQQQQQCQAGGGSDDVPLVFVHGIGMGLVPYVSFLFNMAATGRPLLALELPHISQRWVLWVPTVDEVTEVLATILKRSGIRRAALVGHSYGSAVASRLLQQQPESIHQLCLIDPVCFSMFMPNLLRNFLYESPKSGSLVGDFMMVSAARELHVSATLSRKFFWSDVNLWEEQLPPGSLVVLSGKDVLLAAPEVKAWLEQHTSAVVMFQPELAHAGFVLDIPWQKAILQQLLPLVDAPRGEDGQLQHRPPHVHDGSSSHSSPARGPACFRGSAAAAPAVAATAVGAAAHAPAGPGSKGPPPPRLLIAASCSSSAEASCSSSSSSSSRRSFQSCASTSVSAGSSSERSPGVTSPATTKLQGAGGGPFQHAAAMPGFSSPLSYAAGGGAGTGPCISLAASPDGRQGAHSSPLPTCSSYGHHEDSSGGAALWSMQPLSSSSCRSSCELLPPPALHFEMRSWSGVVPPLANGGGDALPGEPPETPGSCATYRSATSVQSKRSASAASAAQQAEAVARLLLQPLVAMQQQRQQRRERHSRRHHSWDGSAAEETGAVAGLVHAQGSGTGGKQEGGGGVLRRVEGLLQRRHNSRQGAAA